MLDTGWHRLEPFRFGAAEGFLRQAGGGDVDVGDRLAHQCVAHRAAGDSRLFTAFGQCEQQALQMLVGEPIGPARDRDTHA